jgi:tetratricopeptide (TPR) repeat protein
LKEGKMMAEVTKKPSRIALLATVCAAALSAGLIVGSPLSAAAQNRPGQQQPPKKKKLPPGAKGFEQYATRDASDKLATGGATRNLCLTTNADEAIKCGTSLYAQDKYAEAVEVFKKAVGLDPRMFRAHYGLAMSYEALGKFKEAAASYKVALTLTPDAARDKPVEMLLAQYALGNSYAAAGQHEEAIGVYRQIIAREATTPLPQVHYNIGLSLSALGRQQEAAAAFEKAVELKPDYAEAHYNLGVLHSGAERYAEAVESFRRALAARADYPEAHYNLGLAYYLMDNNAGLAEQQKKLREMNSPLAAELAKLAGGR